MRACYSDGGLALGGTVGFQQRRRSGEGGRKVGSDRRARSVAQGLAKASQTPGGNLGGAERPPCEGGRKQVPKPGLRAQGSGKRDAVPPRSREHVFPACSWGPPPMAPFPLALFLIPGNHLPLLLLLTARGSIFSSLSGRKKTPTTTHICQIAHPNPLLGNLLPISGEGTNPRHCPCIGHAGPCWVPSASTAGFGPPGGEEKPAQSPPTATPPPSPQPGLGPSTELHLHQP